MSSVADTRPLGIQPLLFGLYLEGKDSVSSILKRGRRRHTDPLRSVLCNLPNQFRHLVPFPLGARLIQGRAVALSLLGITSLVARVSTLAGRMRGSFECGQGHTTEALTAMIQEDSKESAEEDGVRGRTIEHLSAASPVAEGHGDRPGVERRYVPA